MVAELFHPLPKDRHDFLSYNYSPNENNKADVVDKVSTVEEINANNSTSPTSKITNVVSHFKKDSEQGKYNSCKSVREEEEDLDSDCIPIEVDNFYDQGAPSLEQLVLSHLF